MLGPFRWDSSIEMNTKKVGNSPSITSVTYSALSDKRFRSYGLLRIDKTAEICLDRTAAESKPKSEE
jgi:hypothetical protein